MQHGHRLSSDQIDQLAMEFAKVATCHRIGEKGTADMAYNVKHYARFFFEVIDLFLMDLTTLNEARKA
jgi:hypothetical protein